MKNIMLIGFMATGKSTIARRMCRDYQMKIVEMDVEIEKKKVEKYLIFFRKMARRIFEILRQNFCGT